MSKNIINEELKRFNDLLGYDPVKGIKLTEAKTRRTYLAEADPEEGGEEETTDEEGEEENSDFDFAAETPAADEEGGEEGNADFDFGDEGSPEDESTEEGGEETEDEFGTADEFSAADDLESEDEEVEEIDVTSIVKGSDEAKEMAQQAVTVGQENSSYLKSLTDKLSNLETQLSKMDTIASKIGKLEQDIKTPEEKLELRSLDSYPFNVKLSDYWDDKASNDSRYKITTGDENGVEKDFTLRPEDVEDDYNEETIKSSFNPNN